MNAEEALAMLAHADVEEDTSRQTAPPVMTTSSSTNFTAEALCVLPFEQESVEQESLQERTEVLALAEQLAKVKELERAMESGNIGIQWSQAQKVVGMGEPEESPSFGNFLEQQLLPLYVADVPFEYLRRIGETYCGTPLDSDDEDRAWQASGSTSELREQQQQQQHQRRQAQSSQKKRGAKKEQQQRAVTDTGESSALVLRAETSDRALVDLGAAIGMPTTDLATAVAGNKSSAVPLGMLLEAATKDTTAQQAPLRAQMSHSIVEKRRRERRAPPDMALGELRVRRSALNPSTNPASPLPDVSWALLQTPIPFTSPLARNLSPISVRGVMRRQHVLESPLRCPEWGLLDTPHRPKPN